MRIRAATLAFLISAVLISCACPYQPSVAGAATSRGKNASNGSVRFLMWTAVSDCIGLSDAQLLEWKSRGAGGFVCGIGPLAGMGGAQAFAAASPGALGGRNTLWSEASSRAMWCLAPRRWA